MNIRNKIDDIGTFVMIVVLAVAAGLKIYNLTDFSFYLTSITFVPEPWRSRLAFIVPMTELGIAVLLLFRFSRRIGQLLAILVMSIFIIYLSKMLADPYAPECSCFGAVKMAESAHEGNKIALVRNLFLLSTCVVSFFCGISAKKDSDPYRHD